MKLVSTFPMLSRLLNGWQETGSSQRMTPNPSIERTCHGRLRLPRHAAHVER